MSLRGRIRNVRQALKKKRKRLWATVKERHEAQRGSRRRRKLAKDVRKLRGQKDQLVRKLEFLEKKKDDRVPKGDAVVQFDGKPCAAWIVRDLRKIREMGWKGFLLSGFRSPEYSEQLCIQICGQPTCPGRCAGRASEHSQYREPRGACDLDPANVGHAQALLRRIGSPLHNAIGPSDPNHLSASGH